MTIADGANSGTVPETRSWGSFGRSVMRLLPNPAVGRLAITLPDGRRLDWGSAVDAAAADLSVTRWRAFRRLLWEGDIGLARSYFDNDWHSADLAGFLAFGLRNETVLANSLAGMRLARVRDRLLHALKPNTRRGSRRNIAAHYDLGNAFYAQWLDSGMNYSSALFGDVEMSLEQAQLAKLRRVIEQAAVAGGERVLEIGCGWGALSHMLARDHQCDVTALTLSREQLGYVRKRVAGETGQGRVDVHLQDYRDVTGRYDRIVSIEMLEAVGEAYWPIYFRKVRECLADGGRAVLQAITIAEDRFTAYRRCPDVIQRYIFPGGMLPTKSIIRREAERAGLRFVDEESFGQSYVHTLAEWRRRFIAAWPVIERLGFDARFRRMWEYYLAYCETGFRCNAIDVSFFTLAG